VSDAHDIPFADATFDGVVIQAVLHAVIDPRRAIAEVHRVLKPSGLLYVEVPFAQQNCEGAYDFYRYTHLGLRRLLRDFEELRSGAQGGPGMAMAWAYQYFLYSLTSSRRGRLLAHIAARLTISWLVFFDRFLVDRPAALDAASGVYFLGRKSEVPLSDRELVRQYRGSVR
jgi:SAM-dependent methyltransferase